jgi:hypothetical protein
MPASRPALALTALAAALSLAGCGEPCARLSHALCDGGEDSYCQQVDAWLQTRLIDPESKQPLAGEARDQMCTAIYYSVDIFNAYRFKAKQKLLGEPEFALASSTPPEAKADAKTDAKAVDTRAASEVKLPTPVAKPPADEDAEEDKLIHGGANMSD